MLDDDTTSTTPSTTTAELPVRRTRRRSASRPAGPPQPTSSMPPAGPTQPVNQGSPPVDLTDSPAVTESAAAQTAEAQKPAARKTATKRATKKTAAKSTSTAKQGSAELTTADPDGTALLDQRGTGEPGEPPGAVETPRKTPVRRTSSKKSAAATATHDSTDAGASPNGAPIRDASIGDEAEGATAAPFVPLFQAPDPQSGVTDTRTISSADASAGADVSAAQDATAPEAGDEDGGTSRRRRSRGGRSRRKSSSDPDKSAPPESAEIAAAKHATVAPSNTAGNATSNAPSEAPSSAPSNASAAVTSNEPTPAVPVSNETEESSSSSRRRRRRRRSGEDSSDGDTQQAATVTKVREPRPKKETITSVEGSTRVEAKKQRRREGRDAGRRRPPILSESEFLARRESVERVMAIRQRGEATQIAVLEDNILVEHYVALESQGSLIGNIYLGRVQNVLPSMEAAFIDIGKGRNAVLYAGEVNWSLMGGGNSARRIENALKPGQAVMVQVSKDPVGHKGGRLTSQISLAGRYLVSVPGGGTSGISRKLPDTERNRLKNLLKDMLPDDSGVIIRTAAEGASEEELTRDVTRLTARWEDIEKKAKKGQAPQLLYAEPETTLKVVRDLFTEDFAKLVIAGEDAWDMVDGYVQHVAPDLADRLERYDGRGDVFADYRVDEQIAKALERKVWLPSGGSLVIDRTEAMTVVDVNTGKFTGSGGNLEETVTKNNLEAAEEIVRQLRLRDIGGIIVVDFIDMVLESNRDLVLRRLVECLGRDRTRHQVAEVTSLGLVQMTRKRISTGLLEAFSVPCEVCQGRGVIIQHDPVEPKTQDDRSSGGRGRSGRNGHADSNDESATAASTDRTPTDSGKPHTDDHGGQVDDANSSSEAAAKPKRPSRRRGAKEVAVS